MQSYRQSKLSISDSSLQSHRQIIRTMTKCYCHVPIWIVCGYIKSWLTLQLKWRASNISNLNVRFLLMGTLKANSLKMAAKRTYPKAHWYFDVSPLLEISRWVWKLAKYVLLLSVTNVTNVTLIRKPSHNSTMILGQMHWLYLPFPILLWIQARLTTAY